MDDCRDADLNVLATAAGKYLEENTATPENRYWNPYCIEHHTCPDMDLSVQPCAPSVEEDKESSMP